MQLETERLILRSFREEDVDAMARLFANLDFMRFSLGVFTERKQTVAFIEKVMGWDRADLPSQFAVVLHGAEAAQDESFGFNLHMFCGPRRGSYNVDDFRFFS